MGNETFLPNNRGEIKVYFLSLVYDITNHYLCNTKPICISFLCKQVFVFKYNVVRT